MSTELGVIPREEWERRYAARIMERAGWPEHAAIEAGRVGAEEFERNEREAGNAVVWRGALPPDQFDEFVVLTKLPDAAGDLPFPAIQSCGAAQNRWVEVPPAGGPRPAHPAPILRLSPASPNGGHDHH